MAIGLGQRTEGDVLGYEADHEVGAGPVVAGTGAPADASTGGGGVPTRRIVVVAPEAPGPPPRSRAAALARASHLFGPPDAPRPMRNVLHSRPKGLPHRRGQVAARRRDRGLRPYPADRHRLPCLHDDRVPRGLTGFARPATAVATGGGVLATAELPGPPFRAADSVPTMPSCDSNPARHRGPGGTNPTVDLIRLPQVAHEKIPGDPDVVDFGAPEAVRARRRAVVVGTTVHPEPHHRAAVLTTWTLRAVPAVGVSGTAPAGARRATSGSGSVASRASAAVSRARTARNRPGVSIRPGRPVRWPAVTQSSTRAGATRQVGTTRQMACVPSRARAAAAPRCAGPRRPCGPGVREEAGGQEDQTGDGAAGTVPRRVGKGSTSRGSPGGPC